MAADLKELVARLKAKPAPAAGPDYAGGLSTGSTLLNLACSGRPDVGFLPGHVYLLVGDSSSGKTFLSLTCFAEACRNRHYDDYRLVYDNAEDGALMDWDKYFGRKAALRVQPPRGNRVLPEYSATVEQFYDNLNDAMSDSPVLYVLDSMDALSSTAEAKAVGKQRLARRKGGKESGSYGDGKAKANSSLLRLAHNKVVETGSILIIVMQTRDNIGLDAMFNPKVRAGGRAPTFYATLELWSSVKGLIRKPYKGKNLPVGITSKVQVKKNRLTGRNRSVEFPIYYDTGIDDVGGMVRYLLDWEFWKKGKGGIIQTPEDVNFAGTEEDLIRYVEENNLEKLLRKHAAAAWREAEAALAVERKPRYK